jgi:hypothetical protein
MKRFIVLAALACGVVSVTAVVANAEGGKLKCFADAPAACTPNSATAATLDTTSGRDEQQVYAFVDAQACLNNGTAPSGGELPVSTTLATCPMTLNTGGSWANWDAFAAANPSDTIASALPFVIADVATGEQISVSNVDSTRS